MITGHADIRAIIINGKQITPERSLALVNHSPTGFNWGYHGSGPAQTALAILLEFTDQDTALKLYQDFKRDIIASFKSDQDFRLANRDVNYWLTRKKEQLKKKEAI